MGHKNYLTKFPHLTDKKVRALPRWSGGKTGYHSQSNEGLSPSSIRSEFQKVICDGSTHHEISLLEHSQFL